MKEQAITKTPGQWAREKGFVRPGRASWQPELVDWRFPVAATVHGWAEHEHHAGEPMQLTEEQFDAAIAAASEPKGNPVAHAPATSKYAPKRA